MIEYRLSDICTGMVSEASLKVGRNEVFASSDCETKTINTMGECINEVGFFRDNRRYYTSGVYAGNLADFGMKAMWYKTNKGNTVNLGSGSVVSTDRSATL